MLLEIKTRISHKLWRKYVKRKRRSYKRRQEADQRDEAFAKELDILLSDPNYVCKLEEEKKYVEKFQLYQEELACERRNEWRTRDLALHSLWCFNQQRKKKIDQDRKNQEEKIRKEFEENHTLDVKEALLQQASSQLGNEVEVTHNPDPPPGYVRSDLRPKREPCPFFLKTGACRFGINCSREHDYPETSHTVLLSNMYTHFGMEGAFVDDYDTDIALEYTDADNYIHFREFFEDVLPEFQKIGKVLQFKTCNNKSCHLKGNVYVQFEKVQHAQVAVSLFNGRWYAGKQITCIFVPVQRWKSAICGLYWSKKCPKGDQCNFLHVFRNPGNAFHDADLDRIIENHHSGSGRSDCGSSSRRSRYSESPRERKPASDSSRERKPTSDSSRERRPRSDSSYRREDSKRSTLSSKAESRISSRKSSSKRKRRYRSRSRSGEPNSQSHRKSSHNRNK